MPFLDQRYQLINGPRLNNLSPVLIIDSTALPLQITDENVVVVNSGALVPPIVSIVLPPITPENQGRAVWIKNRFGDGDTLRVGVGNPGDRIEDGLADQLFIDIGDGGKRLLVARSGFNDGVAPAPFNIWWVIDSQ